MTSRLIQHYFTETRVKRWEVIQIGWFQTRVSQGCRRNLSLGKQVSFSGSVKRILLPRHIGSWLILKHHTAYFLPLFIFYIITLPPLTTHRPYALHSLRPPTLRAPHTTYVSFHPRPIPLPTLPPSYFILSPPSFTHPSRSSHATLLIHTPPTQKISIYFHHRLLFIPILSLSLLLFLRLLFLVLVLVLFLFLFLLLLLLLQYIRT